MSLDITRTGFWWWVWCWFIFNFQLVSQHGAEADRHLFRCLFSHVDFSGDGRSSGKDFHQVCFETHGLTHHFLPSSDQQEKISCLIYMYAVLFFSRHSFWYKNLEIYLGNQILYQPCVTLLTILYIIKR